MIATTAVGLDPEFAAVDPSTGMVYVTNGGSGDVSVVNGTVTIGTIKVGSDPVAATINEANGCAYVSEWGAGTVGVVGSSYRVTFMEVGLPSGTNWSLALNGISQSSTGTTIAFMVPNGTYPFGVGSTSGYAVTPSAGNVTVRGAPASQPLTFSPSEGGGSSTEFLGFAGTTGYYLLGGIVTVVLVGVTVALILRARRR